MMEAAIHLLSWVIGFLILFRVPGCRPNKASTTRYPSLSIIIPARDEADNLPRLLRSLNQQDPPPDEIWVVDDESTDGTAQVAQAAGARVITSAPLPEGWRGKTWACHQGAQVARGDVLLFLDADTFLTPGGLRAIWDTFLEKPGALSLGAYHMVQRPYEHLSAYFNIVMTAAMGSFTIWGPRLRPQGMFGPFLMIRRADYAPSGGHVSVRSRVLENFNLARQWADAGIAIRCLGGRETFCFRMYPHGLRELIAGWSKAFASGAAQTPVALLIPIVVWIAGGLGTVLHLIGAACAGAWPATLLWAGLYMLFALQLHIMLRQIGSFRSWAAALYPLPLSFFLLVFARAALLSGLRRKTTWKGRTFARQG